MIEQLSHLARELRHRNEATRERSLLRLGMLLELWFRPRRLDDTPERLLPKHLVAYQPTKQDRVDLRDLMIAVVSDTGQELRCRLEIAVALSALRDFEVWRKSLEFLVECWDALPADDLCRLLGALAEPFTPPVATELRRLSLGESGARAVMAQIKTRVGETAEYHRFEKLDRSNS